MLPFDNIIEDVASRFGLGVKAAPLLRELLTLITSSGGISAFIDKFKSAGLSSEVNGWLGNAGKAAAAPTSLQVEQALGSKTVDAIAQKVGLTGSAASAALGYLMPKLIGQLTPGGVIGTGIPSAVTDFLRTSTSGSTFRPKVPFEATAARASANPGRWIAPLLALLALAGLGWYFLSRETPATVATTTTSTTADPMSSMVTDATNKATAALAGLGSGFRTTDFLGILNKSIINFPTGSAEIPTMSMALLQAAAKPFKQLPAGTVIEIGGYTDNTGDAAANLPLSQHRADAVRNALLQFGVNPAMLMAKGYGSAKPVASNDTAEGRFQNRRIEYQVSDGSHVTEGSASPR
jgi:outer membrane protein OmpA-like peptidoglycan-associated protein/uncharacterized protein YidB (DUF937 family)